MYETVVRQVTLRPDYSRFLECADALWEPVAEQGNWAALKLIAELVSAVLCK